MYLVMVAPGLLATTVMVTGCALALRARPLAIIAVSRPLRNPCLFIAVPILVPVYTRTKCLDRDRRGDANRGQTANFRQSAPEIRVWPRFASPSPRLGRDNFERYGGQSAERNALPVRLRRGVGGRRHSLRGDTDDQVPFQTGLGFGIALEHDLGSIPARRCAPQLDPLRRFAQLVLDLAQQIVRKGWHVNLKPGYATGGNVQGLRRTDPDGDSEHDASADRDLQVIGGDQVAVSECLHHVLRRNRHPADLVSLDARAAFEAQAQRLR